MPQPPETVLAQLLDQVQTLQIASLNTDGEPAISSAPFVRDVQGNFYIFVSQLAAHTQALLNHRYVEVLLLEDEQEARQIFARKRLSYRCVATAIAAAEPSYTQQLQRMQERFGEVITLLAKLPDFVLFRLQPQSGRFVMGFGQAFSLIGENLTQLQAIQPKK